MTRIGLLRLLLMLFLSPGSMKWYLEISDTVQENWLTFWLSSASLLLRRSEQTEIIKGISNAWLLGSRSHLASSNCLCFQIYLFTHLYPGLSPQRAFKEAHWTSSASPTSIATTTIMVINHHRALKNPSGALNQTAGNQKCKAAVLLQIA